MPKKMRAWPEFTKEMKKDYTILIPNMCTIHFELLKNVFRNSGYNVELLVTTDQRIIDEGLKYVHNDTCYPALLCIGQMMDALHSGRYDLKKVALIMTQTGGGCRASNYIHLLRKALLKDGLGHIPVISLSVAGLEKNSGFKLTLPFLRKALASITYGDLLMLLANQTRPYEVAKGETDSLVGDWVERLSEMFAAGRASSKREMSKWFPRVVQSFAAIPRVKIKKIKVGIVGEIYVKYSALANNHLERFLHEQGCEVMVPGLLGFLLYCCLNPVLDIELYGGGRVSLGLAKFVYNYLSGYEDALIQAVKDSGEFIAPWPNSILHKRGREVIGAGCKMGEGWLLTAEMVELIEHGYSNIVCAQPFGCLPNHIAGKGMIRKMRDIYKSSNIVAIDYDPGATRVNQENRIRLMLSVAGDEASPEMPKHASAADGTHQKASKRAGGETHPAMPKRTVAV